MSLEGPIYGLGIWGLLTVTSGEDPRHETELKELFRITLSQLRPQNTGQS